MELWGLVAAELVLERAQEKVLERALELALALAVRIPKQQATRSTKLA
jgi:hypothetical protein